MAGRMTGRAARSCGETKEDLIKKKILFICTRNTACSQMAEGCMNATYGDRHEVFSGGTKVTRVHPMAIEAMKEIGIDISGHRSKLIDEHFAKGMETVVTICDSAQKACPFFPMHTGCHLPGIHGSPLIHRHR